MKSSVTVQGQYQVSKQGSVGDPGASEPEPTFKKRIQSLENNPNPTKFQH